MVVEPLESEETLVTKMRLAWRKGRNWLRYTRTRDPSDTHTTTTTTVVEETQRGENHGAAINFYLKPKNQRHYFVFAYYRKIVVTGLFFVRVPT